MLARQQQSLDRHPTEIDESSPGVPECCVHVHGWVVWTCVHVHVHIILLYYQQHQSLWENNPSTDQVHI